MKTWEIKRVKERIKSQGSNEVNVTNLITSKSKPQLVREHPMNKRRSNGWKVLPLTKELGKSPLSSNSLTTC